MATATRTIRVLVVDDEPDLRLLLGSLLALDPRFEVAGEASDGPSAIDAFHHVRPDVVVLDHRMPGMTGLQVAEVLLAQVPAQPIVLFSAFLDSETRQAATAAGVKAVLSKEAVFDLAGVLERITE